MTDTPKNILIAQVGFVVLWSSGFIGSKYGLEHVDAYTLLFLRYAIVAVALLALCVVLYGNNGISWSLLGEVSLIGTLAHALHISTLLAAFTLGATAGSAALIGGLQPIITGVASRRVLGHTIEIRQWTGLAIGFAAVLLISLNRVVVGGNAVAYLMLLTSVGCLTVASLHQQKLYTEATNERQLPLTVNLALQCTASSIVLSIPALLVGDPINSWRIELVVVLLWLSFAVSLGGAGMFWFLLKHRPATQVASLTYLIVPVTMMMGYFAFGESLTCLDITGLVLAAIGVKLAHVRMVEE